MSQLQCIHRTN